MHSLIDSSLWIDFTRARSPQALKLAISTHILSPQAALAEPVMYEVLRHATEREVVMIEAQFKTMPCLPTPDDLWPAAAKLGQRCRKRGINAGSLDLLIVTVALHNDAEVITFDRDFETIGLTCNLRVKLLHRPR